MMMETKAGIMMHYMMHMIMFGVHHDGCELAPWGVGVTVEGWGLAARSRPSWTASQEHVTPSAEPGPGRRPGGSLDLRTLPGP